MLVAFLPVTGPPHSWRLGYEDLPGIGGEGEGGQRTETRCGIPRAQQMALQERGLAFQARAGRPWGEDLTVCLSGLSGLGWLAGWLVGFCRSNLPFLTNCPVPKPAFCKTRIVPTSRLILGRCRFEFESCLLHLRAK